MSRDFNRIYSTTGRPSIPPELLLKATLLQILYGIRSERLLLEQIDYSLLYRWFLGLSVDDEIWDESVFSKNRDRLLEGEIAKRFFNEVVKVAQTRRLVSQEHFTVDGTLVEAWASLKSLAKKEGKDSRKDDGDPGNPSVDFKGEKRTNDTHQSTTDPEAKIYTKSKGVAAKLNFMGHVLMENRNGLAVGATVTSASFHAEHEAALEMVDELKGDHGKTLGGDKHYDDFDFCGNLRKRNVTPHVAQNLHSRRHHSAIDGRTTRHPGYEISSRKRKRVEEIFGWLKQWGPFRRQHFRGQERVAFFFTFGVATYNLLRIVNLSSGP
jgi:transposase